MNKKTDSGFDGLAIKRGTVDHMTLAMVSVVPPWTLKAEAVPFCRT